MADHHIMHTVGGNDKPGPTIHPRYYVYVRWPFHHFNDSNQPSIAMLLATLGFTAYVMPQQLIIDYQGIYRQS